LVHWVRLAVDPERHFEFSADGELEIAEEFVRWEPPPGGGALRYLVRIDHLRDKATYDARLTRNWAIFRGDDLVPPARVDTVGVAESRATLSFKLPDGWSIAVPYEKIGPGRYRVHHPHRRFDRPTGWMALGKIGVTRERIAGSHIAIAGPVGQGLRRQDLLAMMRWTLPELRDVTGGLPSRILIVGAGDPMWRGGLSGPASLFLHADRPMITPDGTSPLLHELVHAVTRLRAGPGGDWIVEGVAELYSVELLARSKSMSRRRYAKVLRKLKQEGASVRNLETDRASGDVTARAVSELHELDETIREATDGQYSLDDLVARLTRERVPVTTEGLRAHAEATAGRDLGSFFAALPRDRGLAKQP
ncbi:MAG: hypothetical protein HKP27_14490, partial [Myxococcales bacterium]|nr:hypothetical protein [Myxococcales bacterium]